MVEIYEELKAEFETSQDKFQDFKADRSRLVVRQTLSKGHLFNLRPFENEMYGFRAGRELRKMPVNVRDVYIYSFDANHDIIMVQKYGSGEDIMDHEFCIYGEESLKSFYFSSGGPSLRNVKLSVTIHGLTTEVHNYGKYGVSSDYYRYNDLISGRLEMVEHISKEHGTSECSNSVFSFEYGQNDNLVKIAKRFPNGNTKVVFLNVAVK